MGKRFANLLGWYGTVAILLAYGLLNFSILTPNNFFYQLLNLTGAVGLAIETFRKKDYQPGILNIIWAIIAGLAILKTFLLF